MKQLNHLYLLLIFTISLAISSTAENKPKINNIIELNQQKPAGIKDIIRAIGNFIGDLSRPVWGAYEVNGQNNNAPFALFNRQTFQSDRLAIIANI